VHNFYSPFRGSKSLRLFQEVNTLNGAVGLICAICAARKFWSANQGKVKKWAASDERKNVLAYLQHFKMTQNIELTVRTTYFKCLPTCTPAVIDFYLVSRNGLFSQNLSKYRINGWVLFVYKYTATIAGTWVPF